MAESILVTGKRISSMELVSNVRGDEKIPTGQPEDLAITPNQIADHTILRGDLASQEDISQVEVNLTTQIDAVELEVANQSSSIRTLLDAETQARISGDDALQTSIDALEGGSQGLRSDLEAEIQARIAADDLKVDKAGSVKSVAGRTGEVVLTANDIGYPELSILDTRVKEARFIQDASGLNQQEFNDSLVGVGDKLKRENVSVWDFFTSAELDAYKASPTTFDAYRPIQAFFTYIAQNDVGTAYCSITACISQGLLMGVKGVHKTLVVNGNMQLTALNAIDTMIQREIGQDFEWVGLIYLIGHRTATSPSYTYRYRTCRVGMSTHLTYNNARQKWGGLRFMYFQQHGLQVRGATTASQYKYVRANGCGTGLYGDSRYRFETTFNNRVDTGTSGSSTQRTTITVAELPSSAILQDQAQNYIVVNNEPYLITAYDIDASTITVIPWIDLTVTSGTLSYMIGGGVDLRGGDSSAVQFGYVEGTNCGIMFNDCALYTANIGMLMAQANGCGYNAGSEFGAATIGGTLDSMYIEGNHINLMFTSAGTLEKVVGNTYALDLAKVKVLALRLANNTYAARTLGNGRLTSSGVTYTGYGLPNNAVNNVTVIDIFDRRNLGYTYRHNNVVFSMPVINAHKNSLTGLDNTFIRVIGTSANNLPTTVTFRPAAGCTVNGSSSDVVFSGFTVPPQFDIYAQISTGNYIVMCKDIQKIEGVATVVYDPPPLAAAGEAGDSTTTAVALPGVVVGAIVQAAFSRYHKDVETSAAVSADGTVTVKFKNTGAAPVDLASGTLTVKLI